MINSGAAAAPKAGSNAARFLGAVRYDYAQSTRSVYLVMAGIMAASFVVAVRRMEPGVPREVSQAELEAEPAPVPP